MKLKTWILLSLLFLSSGGLWTTYVLSRRAFLRDFDGGVHAYLAGNFTTAEQHLTEALKRRPRNAEVQQLLTKVLIEQSFAQYHQKDYAGALETLSRASQRAPADRPTQQALTTLREQLAVPPEQRPVNMEQVLDQLYRHLPDQEQPSSLPSLLQQWLKKSEMSQEAVLKRFSDSQERWLSHLDREKDTFRKILYGGLALFGMGGVVFLVLFVGVLHAYFGRRGVFARLLDDHYRRLVAALPAGTQVLLGPPVSLLSGPEASQMDVIEAEIVSGHGGAEESHRRLELLLEEGNPWIRARAAKILYQLNPSLALEELKRLTDETSNESQISGMWALGELATPEALDLLAPLAYSPVREIQQGAIRSLLQLQTKEGLPDDIRVKLNRLLSAIRSRTGWVF